MNKSHIFICLFLSFIFSFHHVDSSIPCSHQTDCYDQLGPESTCVYGHSGSGSGGSCSCQQYQYVDPSENSTCQDCPGFGESCQISQCCRGDYLICYQDICKCIYDDYCWLVSLSITNSERIQFQRIAQCVLAVALMLTAGVLFILFWNACNRKNEMRRRIEHQFPADSFMSLNSIQRLVLMQLQDRPPPYSPEAESNKPWKNLCEITEPPPTYVEAVGLPIYLEGIENPAFISENNLNTNPSLTENNNIQEISRASYAPSIQISCISWDQASTSENTSVVQVHEAARNDPQSQSSQLHI